MGFLIPHYFFSCPPVNDLAFLLEFPCKISIISSSEEAHECCQVTAQVMQKSCCFLCWCRGGSSAQPSGVCALCSAGMAALPCPGVQAVTESKNLSSNSSRSLLGYEMVTQSKWTDLINFCETGQAVTFPFFAHSGDEVVSVYKCWVILKFCQHCCWVHF